MAGKNRKPAVDHDHHREEHHRKSGRHLCRAGRVDGAGRPRPRHPRDQGIQAERRPTRRCTTCTTARSKAARCSSHDRQQRTIKSRNVWTERPATSARQHRPGACGPSLARSDVNGRLRADSRHDASATSIVVALIEMNSQQLRCDSAAAGLDIERLNARCATSHVPAAQPEAEAGAWRQSSSAALEVEDEEAQARAGARLARDLARGIRRADGRRTPATQGQTTEDRAYGSARPEQPSRPHKPAPPELSEEDTSKDAFFSEHRRARRTP